MQAIDLKELYKQAFGVSVPEYQLYEQKSDKAVYSGKDNGDGLLRGKFGSIIYGNNAIGGNYTFMPAFFDLDNDGDFGANDYELPFPIMRISSQKRIVETPLTERKGTVVEIVSQQNWKIYIKGFIVSKDASFPEEEVYRLKQLYEDEKNPYLRLRCALTDLFLTTDDRVVITDLNFPDVKGIENVKPYEMNLITTNIFDLNVKA
jgi:hypothetical protein